MTDEDYANGEGGVEETMLGNYDPKPDAPLMVNVRDGMLRIEIGINTLARALEQDPQNILMENGRECRFVVNDNRRFAEGVADALLQEDERGESEIAQCITAAQWAAVENDCGVEERWIIPQ